MDITITADLDDNEFEDDTAYKIPEIRTNKSSGDSFENNEKAIESYDTAAKENK